jgi:hypothetical protein
MERPTTADYERLRYDLVTAFQLALHAAQAGEDAKTDTLTDIAFQLAAKHGWNYEADKGFQQWCLKATQQECLVRGLTIALSECHCGEES